MNQPIPDHVMNEWRKQCSCDERFRPCEGVMAGGFCDEQHDDDEDDNWDWYDDSAYDY